VLTSSLWWEQRVIIDAIFRLRQFMYVSIMLYNDTYSIQRSFHTRSVLVLCVALLISGCGSESKEIPQEERGEPNVLPEEIILYREAREAFKEWVRLFESPRSYQLPYRRLSAASKTKLRSDGVTDADTFGKWFSGRAAGNEPPFFYIFSRFDILDIEMRDTVEALLTATFLVHVHQSAFESVGTFRLKRQGGVWVVPFAESADYEKAWWQKERNFASRVQEEGLSSYMSEALGLAFRYPITWDVTESSSLRFPSHPAAKPGIELTYVDPVSLQPQAMLRIAAVQAHLSDSVRVDTGANEESSLQLLRSEETVLSEANVMKGKTFWLIDDMNDRYILVMGVVDMHSDYKHFSPTINSILSSIVTSRLSPQ